MDPSMMQQSPAEPAINGNGTESGADEISTPEEETPKSYDALFPSLPAAAPPAPGAASSGVKMRKPMLAASVVTQVRF